jgi:hypothetical protein
MWLSDRGTQLLQHVVKPYVFPAAANLGPVEKPGSFNIPTGNDRM